MTWRIDMEYGKIRNIAELKAARRKVSKDISAKERELMEDYMHFRSYLDPMAYVNRLLVRLYSFRHLFEGIRTVAGKTVDFFSSWKRTKPAEKAERTENADESINGVQQ